MRIFGSSSILQTEKYAGSHATSDIPKLRVYLLVHFAKSGGSWDDGFHFILYGNTLRVSQFSDKYRKLEKKTSKSSSFQ